MTRSLVYRQPIPFLKAHHDTVGLHTYHTQVLLTLLHGHNVTRKQNVACDPCNIWHCQLSLIYFFKNGFLYSFYIKNISNNDLRNAKRNNIKTEL